MWTAEERRRVKKASERAVAHQPRKWVARLLDLCVWPDRRVLNYKNIEEIIIIRKYENKAFI